VAYYAEKQRAALYDFDEEELRPYFPLERVVDGLFETVQRLYGIRVAKSPAFPCGTRRCVITRCTTRRQLHRRVLRRLVSAREQARRRVDGCADHRLSGARRAASSRTWA
jgi:hypothetical protein